MIQRSLIAVLFGGLLFSLGVVPAQAATPTLSINDVTVTEPLPGEDAEYALFTVTLSEPSDQMVRFTATVAGDGGNVELGSRDEYLTPGATSTPVWVLVKNNGQYDPEPLDYTVTLSDVTGAAIEDGTGILTVVNSDPNGKGISCQASARRDVADGATTTTGLANAAFTPCSADLDAGSAVDGSPRWRAETGSPRLLTWSYGDGEARARYDEFEEGAIGVHHEYEVSAESTASVADVRCDGEAPVLTGRSWVSAFFFRVMVYDPTAKYYEPLIGYGVPVGTSEPVVQTLPDGTTVGLNQQTVEPFQSPDGETGEVLTQRAVVITSPTGDERVYGESRVAYVGNPCAT